MRKKGSRTKTKTEETADLEIPLNQIAVKLHRVCYNIDVIDNTPVKFMWISQRDKDFTTHFKSETEEYILTFSQNDVIIKSLEELTEMILNESTKKVKEVLDDSTGVN